MAVQCFAPVRGVVIAAIALLFMLTPRAWGISYHVDDFLTVHPGLGAFIAPHDLLRPSQNIQVQVVGGAGGVNTGAIIAKDWILSAFHASPQAGTDGVIIDGVHYYVAERQNAAGFPGLPNSDLTLLRITALDGSAVDFSSRAIPIARDPSVHLPGTAFTVGGNGISFGVNASGQVIYSLGKQLRFGRMVIAVQPVSDAKGGPGLSYFTSRDPTSLAYVKYVGGLQGGDSGGGWFAADGWDWQLIAVNSDPFAAANTTNPAVLDWIDAHVTTLPPTSTAIPAPDTEWQGATTLDWSTANWTNGVPTAGSNAWVNNDPRITASTGVARARNVFVGVDGDSQWVSDGLLTVQGGALEVTDTLYIGAEVGDSGMIIQSGGAVTASTEFVGFRGDALYSHRAGTHVVDGTLNVGRYSGSLANPAKYLMQSTGNGSLTATGLIIGGAAGSHGEFEIKTGGTKTVTSNIAIVGGYGAGKFIQSNGTVETAQLYLGFEQGGQGTYQLNGGRLSTQYMQVGVGGSSQFVQNGGVHAAGTIILGSQGTYDMFGGVLELTGGLSSSGILDLHNSLSTVRVATNGAVANYRHVTLLNAGSATLDAPVDSLLILAAAPSFGVNANGGLAPHVSGTPLVINQNGFRAYGDVSDPVFLGGSGYIRTAGAPTGQPRAFLNMVHLDMSGGSSVTIESNSAIVLLDGLVVSGGVATINQQAGGLEDGFLEIEGLPTSAVGIEVKGAARLIGGGLFNFPSSPTGQAVIRSGGTLEVGPGVHTLSVLGSSLTLENGSSLILDVTASGADQLSTSAITIDGTLFLNAPSTSIPDRRDVYVLVKTSTTDTIEQFDNVRVGLDGAFATNSVMVTDPTAPAYGIGMAILYPKDFNNPANYFSLGTVPAQSIVMRATLPGDANGDDTVDNLDFDRLNMNIDQPGMWTWTDGDFTGDGVVNIGDFVILQNHYNKTWIPGSPQSIPEPNSCGLVTLALAACIACRRRVVQRH